MKDVVQLQELGSSVKSTKKWRRGKTPKEEVRISAVNRLVARLTSEDVGVVVLDPIFEAAPAPAEVIVEALPEVVDLAPIEVSAEPFPDELLTPPAPTEEAPRVELPLEAPEESVKPRRKKKFLDESAEPLQPAGPIILELVDKAENTSDEAPQE